MNIVLYGVAMDQAVRSGDLAQMKDLASKAEHRLSELGNSRSEPNPSEGDLRGAFERLKKEIAKMEGERK